MRSRHRLTALRALLTAAAACLGLCSQASADATQTTILEANTALLDNPNGTLMQARSLGISTIRVTVDWGALAPRGNSFRQPRFNQTDPAAYSGWGQYDTLIREATALKMTVDLDLGPAAPLWATGPGQPHVKGYPFNQWDPDAADFGQFARAIGERYSGSYDPNTRRLAPGNRADLPRVSFWSVWNEPDYGPSLAPQVLPGHPGVEFSPREYRALANQAWLGLAASGHPISTETFLIGELAPRSQLTPPGQFADFNGMTPVLFLQNLYCENVHYRPWTGQAATLRGCPSTAAARRSFVRDNPALFQNSGISDHPYDNWFAPDVEQNVPVLQGYAQEIGQYASLATLSNLEHALDEVGTAWGIHARPPIWNTEYGYITSPPHRPSVEYDHHPWPNQTLAGYYDNWAEYLSWRDPRIRSFDQYLIQDAVPATAANDYGSFASGLVNFNGTLKGDYGAFRMPLYLPRTTTSVPSGRLEVWGAARPAAVGALDEPTAPETVKLLFEPHGVGRWYSLGVVPVSKQGYYNVYVAFGSSGILKAEYIAPVDNLLTISDTRMFSRGVQVTVG